jgi:hypothetical protein
MTVHTKRASLVVTVLLVFTIYRVVSDVLASGGLGAVSAGASEAILEFLVLSALVCLFYYWRHRRASKVQPQSPAPRL